MMKKILNEKHHVFGRKILFSVEKKTELIQKSILTEENKVFSLF
jgi:hypothetical protein